MKDLKLRKKDVAEIIAAAYPEYNGRKFRLSFQEKYQMSDYWSDGSRTYVTAVKLQEGCLRMSSPGAVALNPFNKESHIEFDIPKNAALIEHIYVCGKDLGIRVIVHPDTVLIPKLLSWHYFSEQIKKAVEAFEHPIRTMLEDAMTRPADIQMNTELHKDDLSC